MLSTRISVRHRTSFITITISLALGTRVANLTLLGVQAKIQEYQGKLNDLKTRLNERVNIANVIALGRIDIKLMRCLNQVGTTGMLAVMLHR